MKRTRLAAWLFGASLLALTAAIPGATGAGASPPEPGQSDRAGDFNGDSFADLAVGVPYEDLNGIDDAGAVQVIYGTATGLNGDLPVDDQLWHQNSSGVADSNEPSDQFGRSLAWGDFDKDGFDDLAIGIPFEDVPSGTQEVINAGAVQILFGSPSGLTATGAAQLTQNSSGIVDLPEPGERFGMSLAAGNMGRGAPADLAVGVTRESISGVTNAGAVNVIYGTKGVGLTSDGNQQWHQDVAALEGVVETNDEFGTTLAIAGLDSESPLDLAIGTPLEDVGSLGDAGAVNVIYGSRIGLTPTGDQLWHQDVSGIGGVAEAGDRFGSSLATGNFGLFVESDLAVGVPYEDAAGANDTGAVNVLYGVGSGGLTSTDNQVWYSGTTDVPGDPDPNDHFGWALAAGDFGGSGDADLAVGVPDNDLSSDDSGAVVVLYGALRGLTAAGARYWHQDVAGIEGETDIGDRFGGSLSTSNLGRTGEDDLAVGVPGESEEGVFTTDYSVGAVNVLFGSASGLSASNDQFWWQASDTLHDSAEEHDQFGFAVA